MFVAKHTKSTERYTMIQLFGLDKGYIAVYPMERKSNFQLLVYPNFNKPFIIHTGASTVHLGTVISQDNKPIAFYGRKLNPAQVNYTTKEKELLSIVETLKELRNILFGQRIKVYTDHKNLT